MQAAISLETALRQNARHVVHGIALQYGKQLKKPLALKKLHTTQA